MIDSFAFVRLLREADIARRLRSLWMTSWAVFQKEEDAPACRLSIVVFIRGENESHHHMLTATMQPL